MVIQCTDYNEFLGLWAAARIRKEQ
jgi:hypothetical protein